MIEMISKRLTKAQKAEIVKAYKAGKDSNFLADKYRCTTSTIIRTVKTLLSDSEYTLLKEKRSKNSNKKEKIKDQVITLDLDEDLDDSDQVEIDSFDQDISDVYDEQLSIDNQSYKNNEPDENYFELITPLNDFDFNKDKQRSDFETLDYESLPESVYMIVDKKVELDLQPISDLPEWSFLPENELERNAILLFSNQRSAKRSCSRNQKVIKIPNTSVFKLSKPYLISKGITRLILEDTIIALDK
tara:strand:- start:1879 stop:2613 length:735 start_codon:yes stop_codon:yes gene_type:complete